MKYIFFLVVTTLALLSCKAPEKAQKLSLFCYVRYDAAVKAVKAEATLQDAVTKTALEMPGGMRYQSSEMTLAPIYGLTYRHEYNAEFIPEHVFEWRDAKNNKNAFRMSLDPITVFAFPSPAISQSKPTALHWEGAALGKGETMVLMWENTEKGLTVPMEVSSTSGMAQIDIPAAQLKDIVPGDWTLYLVRKKLSKETVDNLPVNGIMEYYSKAIPVKVTK